MNKKILVFILTFFLAFGMFSIFASGNDSIPTSDERYEEKNVSNEKRQNKSGIAKMKIAPVERTIVEISQYPDAEYIWKYFKELGYNDYVIAGIMGNIMMECAGPSLDLNPTVYNTDGYYGMCQWNIYVYDILDADLPTQCEFLANTIKNEFDLCYDAFGFSFEQFIELDNERIAAYRFAQIYERCDSSTYSYRQNYATMAYEYFVK